MLGLMDFKVLINFSVSFGAISRGIVLLSTLRSENLIESLLKDKAAPARTLFTGLTDSIFYMGNHSHL